MPALRRTPSLCCTLRLPEQSNSTLLLLPLLPLLGLLLLLNIAHCTLPHPTAVLLPQDPAVAARMKEMQEAMSRPEVQQQMAEMQAYMQNQQVQQRMAALREDPEFKQMFAEIQTGGMGALMKYMNDPKVSWSQHCSELRQRGTFPQCVPTRQSE